MLKQRIFLGPKLCQYFVLVNSLIPEFGSPDHCLSLQARQFLSYNDMTTLSARDVAEQYKITTRSALYGDAFHTGVNGSSLVDCLVSILQFSGCPLL